MKVTDGFDNKAGAGTRHGPRQRCQCGQQCKLSRGEQNTRLFRDECSQRNGTEADSQVFETDDGKEHIGVMTGAREPCEPEYRHDLNETKRP